MNIKIFPCFSIFSHIVYYYKSNKCLCYYRVVNTLIVAISKVHI